jgi:hypothetical protein
MSWFSASGGVLWYYLFFHATSVFICLTKLNHQTPGVPGFPSGSDDSSQRSRKVCTGIFRGKSACSFCC